MRDQATINTAMRKNIPGGLTSYTLTKRNILHRNQDCAIMGDVLNGKFETSTKCEHRI